MQKQQKELERLVAAYEKMSDADRIALILFAEASAKENPRRLPRLQLIVGHRKSA